MSALFGPLVGAECRRALVRGWLILVRTLAALAILSVTMIALWYGWICVYANPDYRPYLEFRFGLMIVEGILVTIALVIAPAVLAGTLAGEKERGALGLLLTTRLSSREVVLGRFAGKMTQVLMILLVGVPSIVLFAALTGSNARVMGVLLLLPVAIGFGGGGLSMAISAVSRRGRDALLSVYLIDLVFLLVPLFNAFRLSLGPFEWLTAMNPYSPLASLLWEERFEPTWISIGLWTALGLGGLGVATWRVAPACLGHLDGAQVGRAGKRRGRIPPLLDRPMLWKELYIERAGTLGGLGWWVGACLTLLLGVGSIAMAGVMLWSNTQGQAGPNWYAWAQSNLKIGAGGSGMVVAWLIQWAIGLRAAVTIASEREGGTWDAILTSPLEAKEIIRAKLWGSLFALRWVFGAAVLAWSLAFAVGAMSAQDYANLVVGTLVIGAFMAAVGIRASLASTTATRAMAVTIGVWLGALVAFSIIAAILTAIAWLLLVLTLTVMSDGVSSLSVNMRQYVTMMAVVRLTIGFAPYVVTTLFLVSYTRLRFDHLAGRSTEGRFALAAERLLHEPTPVSTPTDRSPIVSQNAE
ncbi:ABC transporter permease [Singulisphaera sp. GP187]|uniref:ABC transporter permease n=1 Tax=Singulisphaera sp. GP187 TaxID=1882752 RepID=UPI0020B12AF5|nr:ABC transporter permease [Singulisphaera sp. GP187]